MISRCGTTPLHYLYGKRVYAGIHKMLQRKEKCQRKCCCRESGGSGQKLPYSSGCDSKLEGRES